MKYPQSLLLPVMMFADYFLTVLGAIQREKKYAQHFQMEHYELNPIWQKSIGQMKWFNPRHAILVVLVCSVITWILECGNLPGDANQVLLGTLLTTFGMVLGRHVSNILVFRYLAKNPDQISGALIMSHQLVLSISMYQISLTFVPIAIIAIFTGSYFACGSILGALMFVGMHLSWKWKAKRRRPVRAAAPTLDTAIETSPPEAG